MAWTKPLVAGSGLAWVLAAGITVLAANPPGEKLTSDDDFRKHPVWPIRIELAPQNLDGLRTESRTYVPANLSVLGETYHDAGIHLKGSTGSFRSLEAKPGFTVDFERYRPGQRFQGLQKIHLNNSVEDGTYLKEQLGSELFRAAGVPVPRVTHARVELNGRRLGLYVLKEGFSEEFLGRYFTRADGNLYDTDLGHDVDLTMKRHLGRESTPDQADLQRLAAAALEPDLSRRWQRLQETLEVDRFVSFMAMEIMVGHWDGYCLGRNNFRVYHDPAADKIVFLPSGMDQLFAKADLPWKPEMAGLVARAIMELPEGRQLYAARFKTLFETLLVSQELVRRVNQLLDELRPFLQNSEWKDLRRETGELCAQIVARENDLRRQLRQPEPARPAFHQDLALLDGWAGVDEALGGKVQPVNGPQGKTALWIKAGSRTSASWRTTARLSRGRYRFQGEAQVANVRPLPFGNHQGAGLRVAGQSERSASLVGTTGWATLKVDFEVSAPEEDKVFICELRAASGEVWFDKHSLVVVCRR